MALSRFSVLLLRNFSFKNPNFHYRNLFLTRETGNLWFCNGGIIKLFSTSQSSVLQTETDIPKFSDPKTSLSARMSFVFDQIDALEKERSNKDEALQRIRAWRETKKKKNDDEDSSKSGFSESVESNLSSETGMLGKKKENLFTKEVEVVHPWPEWIELMERLVQQNYFDHRRNDEDKIAQDLSIDLSGFSEEGFDFTRDWITVRTACLNFGRDRFDILRSLSRQDIQVLVGYGCPSVDTKVVFSAKLLRKHVHLDEGDVCSSCSLRSSCNRGYLLTRKEDEARTLDVMRVLLTFGFDPVNGSVDNKSLLKMKSVKTVVRKLLHEVVKLSAVPIDPNLPPPIIKKAPPKVKQPPPPPKKRVGRDDIEMKKGDWLCPKCDFMNFAKNTVCLQCDAKRPKRQLLPGEWECPGCNFLNYRRNMACFHCEHKRPPDEFMENQMQARPHGPRTRLERVASMPGVSNAWNFDFDDNESDGADVAAFEFADSPRVTEGSFDSHAQGGSSRGFEDDSFETSRIPEANGRDRYSDFDQRKSGTGFDDFDDEEDDDVDSYELVPNNSSRQKASSMDFSESENSDGFDQQSHSRQGTNSSSHNRPSRPMRGTVDLSGSEDDEQCSDSKEEVSVYPNWKSSHIADSRNRARGRGGSGGPYRGLTFGSDNELESDSGSDGDIDRGFGPDQSKRNKWSSNRRDFRRGGSSDSEDALSFGSESDDDDLQSGKNKFRGNKAGPDRRGNTFNGRGKFESARDAQFKSNGRMSDRRNSFGNDTDDLQSRRNMYRGNKAGPDRRGNTFKGREQFESAKDARFKSNRRMSDRRNSFGGADLDRSFQGSSRNDRGYSEDRYAGGRVNDRRGNLQNFGRPGQGEGFGYRQRGRSNVFNDGPEMKSDFSDDRPRRRIIER